MEREPHEPEEAFRGKVLLFMHASELGKDPPAHHAFLLHRVFGFVDLGLNGLDSFRMETPVYKSNISGKEMDLIHIAIRLLNIIGPQLG